MFGDKTAVIEDYCQQFYERQIFHAIINDTDLSEVYLEVAYANIVKADQSFINVDKQLFKLEMTSSRLVSCNI
jgi:hypothetical protein